VSSGVHARGDGSFGRSAGTQTLKGAALLAIAVAIGALLLHTAPANSTTAVSTTPGLTPTTKPPKPARTTRTTVAAAPLVTTTAAPQPHPVGQVKIAVANGSGVAGLAGRIRAQLNSAGFNTSVPALNAPAPVATTSVYYIAGYAPDAAAIATTQLSLPATVVKPMPTPPPVPANTIAGVDVLVIAGADIGGVTTNTTEAPAGNTIAPSPTVSSKPPATTIPSHPPTSAHTTTTVRATTTTR
jgi:LytR cell envelope-related transcriptional attenuator